MRAIGPLNMSHTAVEEAAGRVELVIGKIDFTKQARIGRSAV